MDIRSYLKIIITATGLFFTINTFSQSVVQQTISWVEQYSTPPKLDISLAMQYLKNKDLKNAEAELEILKDAYPNHENVNLLEGQILLEKKKYDKAVEVFTKVLLINPKNEKAYYYRGLAKDIDGDHLGGIVEFTQAIALNPNYSLPYEARATSKSRLKDFFGAIDDYTKALELNNDMWLALEGRALALYETGQYKAAIADFKSVLRQNSKRTYAVYYLGLSRLKDGDKGGCKDLGKALAMGLTSAKQDIDKYCY